MFTDSDWERLEQWLSENKMASRATILDLMRRARAAEVCADYLFKSHGLCCSDCVESVTEWRKEAGK